MTGVPKQSSSKVIKLNQEILEAHTDKLVARLEKVFQTPPHTLVLDMGKVKQLDFVGLGLIFAANNQAAGSGSQLALHNTSPEIEALIHAMQLHEEIEIVPRD